MSDDPSTPPDAQPVVNAQPAAAPAECPFLHGRPAHLAPAADLLLSFLIAFIMFIPSRALSRRTRLPYGLSVVVSFLIAAAIVIGLALLLLPDLRLLLGNITASIRQAYAQLAAPQDNPALSATVQIGGAAIPVGDLVALLQRLLPTSAENLLTNLMHVMFGLFGNVAGLIAAVGTASIVALFFLIDLPISGGTMTGLIPTPYRHEVALLFGKLDVLWLKFFRALIIIGVITGAASLGLFVLFGINGALLCRSHGHRQTDSRRRAHSCHSSRDSPGWTILRLRH